MRMSLKTHNGYPEIQLKSSPNSDLVTWIARIYTVEGVALAEFNGVALGKQLAKKAASEMIDSVEADYRRITQ